MANLFGKNKLRGIAGQIDTEEIKPFIEIIKEWHEDYHNGSLKRDKETSREQEYNQQFFKTILGYKEKPASPFSFEPKATTDKGQLPDAVISYTDTAKDVRNIAAVVELKGASIDLDRPQRHGGNMSPVQQGFKYKTQYRSVPYEDTKPHCPNLINFRTRAERLNERDMADVLAQRMVIEESYRRESIATSRPLSGGLVNPS